MFYIDLLIWNFLKSFYLSSCIMGYPIGLIGIFGAIAVFLSKSSIGEARK